MTTLFSTQHSPAQCLSAPVVQAVFWPLQRGKALRLHAKRASLLRIASGRVWATFDGPHAGAPNDQGDLALGAGDLLPVAAGRHLVIEPLDRSDTQQVTFSFESNSP